MYKSKSFGKLPARFKNIISFFFKLNFEIYRYSLSFTNIQNKCFKKLHSIFKLVGTVPISFKLSIVERMMSSELKFIKSVFNFKFILLLFFNVILAGMQSAKATASLCSEFCNLSVELEMSFSFPVDFSSFLMVFCFNFSAVSS